MNLKQTLIYLLLFAQTLCFAQLSSSSEYEKHTIRVKFKKENRSILKQQTMSYDGSIPANSCGIASIDLLNKNHKLKKISQLFHCTRPSLIAKHEKHGIDLWYEINVEDEVSDELIKEYNDDENIMIAEPIVFSERLDFTPNDLTYRQWHIENPTSYSDGDIRLVNAWDIETGDSDVIVAIIDGGISYAHEDLADAMWVNQAEANGIAGVDDDGNGVIDDINGIAFSDNGTFSPIEPSEHGSHVAGILGAVSNNGIGCAGVAGGNGTEKGVRLMSCGLFTADGYSYGTADRAFIYAADNGAVIANCSWSRETGPTVYEDAIDYFIATAGTDDFGNQIGPMKGGIVIAAAGNDNSTIERYPAAFDNVISVTGTELDDGKYYQGNYGNWIDIAAPAANIYSTTETLYKYLSGTSMACPQVSGVAALLISKYKDQGITPEQVKEAILNSADNIDDVQGTDEFDGLLGSGRLNAFQALSYDLNLTCSTTTDSFSVIEAEDFCDASGIQTEASSEGTDNVGYINNGDWLQYSELDLTEATSVSARVACNYEGGNIEFRTGSTTGTLIGSIAISNTGGNQDYQTFTANISNVSGTTQELYVVFTGGNGFLFNLNWFQFSKSDTTTSFTPDPNKTYYIDSAFHNLRIASSGESEAPYLTSTTTSNDDTKWKFVDKGNGYWHIDRAAAGSKPRLRSDNSSYADMQETSSSGTYTYYEFTEGFINNSYFFTLPYGPTNFKRLQVTPNNEIKMVPTSHIGTWESFYITEADSNPSFSVIEAEDYDAMSGIQTEQSTESGDNVGWINNGDWIRFDNIDLTGAQNLSARVASNFTGGTIEVRTGSANGSLLGSISVNNTGGNQEWETLSTNLNNASGVQDLYLVFTGGSGYLFNINWIQFSGTTASSKIIDTLSSSLSEIILYPSIVSSVTQIDGAANSLLNIYDISGRLLHSKNITYKSEELNLELLSTAGIYYVEVIKEGQKKLIKIVKK